MLARSFVMKPWYVFLLASTAGFGAPAPALSFPPQKRDLPPLTLGEMAKGVVNPVPHFNDTLRFPAVEPPRQTRVRSISQMPIIVPRADLDPKMIKAPDPTVDYKLIIKNPAAESVK
jgi:hypothetical protein